MASSRRLFIGAGIFIASIIASLALHFAVVLPHDMLMQAFIDHGMMDVSARWDMTSEIRFLDGMLYIIPYIPVVFGAITFFLSAVAREREERISYEDTRRY